MAKTPSGLRRGPVAPAAGPYGPDRYPDGHGPGDLGRNMFGQGGPGHALPPEGPNPARPEGADCDGSVERIKGNIQRGSGSY
jgi:hypothetical protein